MTTNDCYRILFHLKGNVDMRIMVFHDVIRSCGMDLWSMRYPRHLLTIAIALLCLQSAAQNIGINEDGSTPDGSAILDIKSDDKGLLIPRLSSAQMLTISNPVDGLLIFNTDESSFYFYDDGLWLPILDEINGDGHWEKNGSTVFNTTDAIAINRDKASSGTTFNIASGSNVLFGDSLSGSGFKLIWYANKGALRFGYLDNPFGGYGFDQFWDYDSVGYYSFAGGQSSRAKGFGAFAWGYSGWADGDESVAFFGQARGNNSYTFGGNSIGNGTFTVEGTAEEEGGIAMYGYTGGRYAVAIGGGTTGLGASSAREDYSVAIGWNSDAIGQASIALGPSDALGYNSFSTGWETEARGNYSSTFGYQTIAYPYGSMAIGRFNTVQGDSASYQPNDQAFVIGDGTSNNNRSNAFTVLKNGRTAVGYNYPTGFLQVSTGLGSLDNGGLDIDNSALLIGTSTSGMAFDANQIESIGSSLYLNFNSPNNLILSSGGGDTQVIHDLGVRTTDIQASLHVASDGIASQQEIVAILESNTSNRPVLMFSENDGVINLTDGMSIEYNGIGAGSANKLAFNAIGGAPLLELESGGDLTLLDGDLRVGSAGGAAKNIRLSTFGGVYGRVITRIGSGDVWIGDIDNSLGELRLYAAGAERMTVQSNGDVRILGDDLIMGGAGTAESIRMTDMLGNNDRVLQRSGNDVFVGDIDNNGGSCYIHSSGTTRMIIDPSGRVGIATVNPTATLSVSGTADKPGGGLWANFSDRRLKQDIRPYSEGLDKVLAIKPVRFRYNEKSGHDTEPEYVGIIAQELQAIAPDMVREVETEEGSFLEADNSALIFMLVNAVQELEARVKELESAQE